MTLPFPYWIRIMRLPNSSLIRSLFFLDFGSFVPQVTRRLNPSSSSSSPLCYVRELGLEWTGLSRVSCLGGEGSRVGAGGQKEKGEEPDRKRKGKKNKRVRESEVSEMRVDIGSLRGFGESEGPRALVYRRHVSEPGILPNS